MDPDEEFWVRRYSEMRAAFERRDEARMGRLAG
jgi:hypothetical protein